MCEGGGKTNESISTSCNISFVRTRLKGRFRLGFCPSRMSAVVAGGELARMYLAISRVSSLAGLSVFTER